ncbi:MAG: ATP-dependent helicase [Lachnospiraceae bacterium]|nr:ATP-dependent helicase [Lachnospiraceae bacterium]
MNFNKSQQTAIRHKDGPMLVLAGPGSGKTAVITQRTINLIHEYGVDPSNILVITFTRAAAQEMKHRFLRAMGEEKSRVTFGTFHAIFFMILKLAYHFENSNIVSEEQRYQLMREIISYHRLEYQDENEFIGELLSEISRVKNERIPLEHFYSSHCGEEIFRKIYQAYDRRLKDSRLIDFDDMLTYTYDLFSQRPDILSAWQKKYRYILIDEFQDINAIQWEIMKMMAAPRNNLFIVGDDDQSIYRFRGSKPEIMLGFTKEYPDTKVVNLNVNYRCAPSIVKAAGKLIAYNEERFPKEIIADSKTQETVRFSLFEEQREENAFIIADIQKAQQAGIPLSEIAVLFRTNTQPRLLMEQMLSCNLTFRAKDRIPNVYEHWIAKDFFAYIRVAQGSDKRADFLTIMNKPNRYIGRNSLCEPQVAFDEWIRMYDEQPWIAERIEKLWHDTRLLNTMSPYAAINYIRRGIGYDDYIADYADYRNVNKEDLYEVADEIQSSAKGYQTLEEWFDHIDAYKRQLERMAKQENANAESVTLATLHSAKGLEFSQVYLIDVNEGIMPYKKAVLKQDIEEERRLFYVGMTRAKERLTICSVKKLRNKEVETSRFIREAGS